MKVNFRGKDGKMDPGVYNIASNADNAIRGKLNDLSIKYASSHTQALVALSRAVGIMTAEMYCASSYIMVPSILTEWRWILKDNALRDNPDEFSTMEDVDIVLEFINSLDTIITCAKNQCNMYLTEYSFPKPMDEYPIELTLSAK